MPLRTLACLGLWSVAWCGCALPRQASERLESEAPTQPVSASYEDAPKEAAVAEEADPSTKHAQSSSSTKTPGVDPAALAEVTRQLDDLKAADPQAHDQLVQDLKHVDPKLWPMLVQGFKASAEYRQRKQTATAAPQTRAAADPPVQLAAATDSPPVRPQQAGPAPPGLLNAIDAKPLTPPSVQPASQQARGPSDWRKPLDATIQSLEAAVAESPGPSEDDRQVYLRLLYLLAGQRDKALRPLTGHDALAQEFWSREIYSLSTYLDAQRVSDRSRRAAEAAIHHWEASNRLSQQGNLLVRNVALCTEVMSYGVYTPFDRPEFQPGQRVVLYAEVENFVSQPTPRGHHTAFESHYEIFDSRGQKVEERSFPPMEEYCHNPRRDFFIAYDDVRLPGQLYDGRYTLKLTIEDTLGKKLGQSSLDFQIKSAATGTRSTR
jgi:hypothetical protein